MLHRDQDGNLKRTPSTIASRVAAVGGIALALAGGKGLHTAGKALLGSAAKKAVPAVAKTPAVKKAVLGSVGVVTGAAVTNTAIHRSHNPLDNRKTGQQY